MNEPLENVYFNWLYSKVSDITARSPRDRYDKLFRLLHQTEFVYLVSGDDNRAEDGMDLRAEFFNEEYAHDDGLFSYEPCSVLEMLIAFSRRASFETEDTPAYWFWTMLSNLGLASLSDNVFNSTRTIQDVVDWFVWRRYDSKGNGGLFPLLNSNKNQSKVELWYQFNQYLIEQRYS